MAFKIENMGLPIVLMASLWGAVSITLNFYQYINRARDQVFALLQECGVCSGQLLGPLDIYLTNMMPLSLGVCLFLFLICYVTLTIPEHMDVDAQQYASARRSCRLIATLPGFGLIGFAGGALFDLIKISEFF